MNSFLNYPNYLRIITLRHKLLSLPHDFGLYGKSDVDVCVSLWATTFTCTRTVTS